MGSLKETVLGALRIPLTPHIPPGEAATAEVLRAGTGYLVYRRLGWAFGQLVTFLGVGVSFVALEMAARSGEAFAFERPLEIALATFALVAAVVSFLVIQWDYECRFYVLTDRCLRIQEGILSFREQTFTIANIQDIDVRQNPIQRVFGIADVVVSTAGGGGGAGPSHRPGAQMHVGSLSGVARASEIRDRLLARLKAYRDGGLGDEPSHRVPETPGAPDLVAALRELRSEARLLRESLPG
ncbi:MAG: PH domain-containing protein [Acidobacteria bacterium]|nr:PH domain-containing protein [Acidobacteriota bacterium]